LPGLFRDIRQLTPSQRGERLAQSANDAEVKLGALLTPEQSARLRQIATQLAGLGAFDWPEIASALSLSREQKEKIRTIRSNFDEQRHRPPLPSETPGETPRKLEELQRERMDAMLEVLNQPQR